MESGKKRIMLGWLALLLITPIYYFANLQKVIIPGAAFDELQNAFFHFCSPFTLSSCMLLQKLPPSPQAKLLYNTNPE